MASQELRESTDRLPACAICDWPAYRRAHGLRVVGAHPGALWRPGRFTNVQCNNCGRWHRAPQEEIVCGCGDPVAPNWHGGDWRAFSPPTLYVNDYTWPPDAETARPADWPAQHAAFMAANPPAAARGSQAEPQEPVAEHND